MGPGGVLFYLPVWLGGMSSSKGLADKCARAGLTPAHAPAIPHRQRLALCRSPGGQPTPPTRGEALARRLTARTRWDRLAHARGHVRGFRGRERRQCSSWHHHPISACPTKAQAPEARAGRAETQAWSPKEDQGAAQRSSHARAAGVGADWRIGPSYRGSVCRFQSCSGYGHSAGLG